MLSAPNLEPPAAPFAVHRAARDVAVPTTLIPEVATGLPSIGINPPLDLNVPSRSAVLHPDPNTITVTMTPTATPTSSPTAAAIAMGSPHNAAKEGDCELLGSFAIFVQLALGALALLALVYKRWRERPQRPVKIWFFDVSKQVFGSVLVHMANVFMSMLTSGRFSIKVVPPTTTVVSATLRMMLRARNHSGDDTYVPNPCSFYLLNLAIDVSIPLSWVKRGGADMDTDDLGHSCSHPHRADHDEACGLHTLWPAPRVDPERQLRQPSQRVVVAKAEFHLLLRPDGHEVLRASLVLSGAMVVACRRLGARLDRGQREAADRLRHDAFPAHHEHDAVLYHRLVHQEAGERRGRGRRGRRCHCRNHRVRRA